MRTEHLCRKYAIFEWFPFVPYVEEAMSVTPAMLMPKPPKIPRMIYMVGGADKVVSKCYCLKEQRLGPVLWHKIARDKELTAGILKRQIDASVSVFRPYLYWLYLFKRTYLKQILLGQTADLRVNKLLVHVYARHAGTTFSNFVPATKSTYVTCQIVVYPRTPEAAPILRLKETCPVFIQPLGDWLPEHCTLCTGHSNRGE